MAIETQDKSLNLKVALVVTVRVEVICSLAFLFTDNCDLHLKVAPDGLSGKPLADEGFSYLLAGARATWGTTKGKVCFECKVAMQFLCLI